MGANSSRNENPNKTTPGFEPRFDFFNGLGVLRDCPLEHAPGAGILTDHGDSFENFILDLCIIFGKAANEV